MGEGEGEEDWALPEHVAREVAVDDLAGLQPAPVHQHAQSLVVERLVLTLLRLHFWLGFKPTCVRHMEYKGHCEQNGGAAVAPGPRLPSLAEGLGEGEFVAAFWGD